MKPSMSSGCALSTSRAIPCSTSSKPLGSRGALRGSENDMAATASGRRGTRTRGPNAGRSSCETARGRCPRPSAPTAPAQSRRGVGGGVVCGVSGKGGWGARVSSSARLRPQPPPGLTPFFAPRPGPTRPPRSELCGGPVSPSNGGAARRLPAPAPPPRCSRRARCPHPAALKLAGYIAVSQPRAAPARPFLPPLCSDPYSSSRISSHPSPSHRAAAVPPRGNLGSLLPPLWSPIAHSCCNTRTHP